MTREEAERLAQELGGVVETLADCCARHEVKSVGGDQVFGVVLDGTWYRNASDASRREEFDDVG